MLLGKHNKCSLANQSQKLFGHISTEIKYLLKPCVSCCKTLSNAKDQVHCWNRSDMCQPKIVTIHFQGQDVAQCCSEFFIRYQPEKETPRLRCDSQHGYISEEDIILDMGIWFSTWVPDTNVRKNPSTWVRVSWVQKMPAAMGSEKPDSLKAALISSFGCRAKLRARKRRMSSTDSFPFLTHSVDAWRGQTAEKVFRWNRTT